MPLSPVLTAGWAQLQSVPCGQGRPPTLGHTELTAWEPPVPEDPRLDRTLRG